MEYKNYKVEDFVLNSRFRRWILNPQKEDHLHWEEYLKKHPEKLVVIEEAKRIVTELPKIDYRLDKEEKSLLWHSISDNISSDISPGRSAKGEVIPMNSDVVLKKASGHRIIRKKKNYLKIGIAAAILLLLSLSIFFNRNLILSAVDDESLRAELISKQNPWGQKSTVFLTDGSEIVLNSGSSISFLKDFEEHQRVVKLEGEAFFKVAKDRDRPFRVIANNVVTQALGTSFNVNSYSDGKTNVALVTGKVVVTRMNSDKKLVKSVYLEPGEQTEYVEAENLFNTKPFSLEEITSWKDGIIYFSDADSKQVFTYLENWYGVKIIQSNQPKEKWNYTGEFNNLDLKNVLTSIGFAMNFDFTKDDKTYLITYQK